MPGKHCSIEGILQPMVSGVLQLLQSSCSTGESLFEWWLTAAASRVFCSVLQQACVILLVLWDVIIVSLLLCRSAL